MIQQSIVRAPDHADNGYSYEYLYTQTQTHRETLTCCVPEVTKLMHGTPKGDCRYVRHAYHNAMYAHTIKLVIHIRCD